MIRRLTAIAVISVSLACSTSQKLSQPSHRFKAEGFTTGQPWRGARFANEKGSFQFAIMADRNGGNRPGVFEQTIHKLNTLNPEFVMSVGDYVKGKSESDSVINAEWEDFFKALAPLHMPFFCLPGNHDITNLKMRQAWIDRFGRTYYHFLYDDVLFLCLDTEDPPASHLSDGQVDYALKVLRDNSKVRWTMVFMHKPLYKYDNPAGFEKIEAALQGRPFTVIAGHEHKYEHTIRNSRDFYVLSTTGGSSPLRGPAFGEFDGVVWVTMTATGPVLTNILVDGILQEEGLKRSK
jgi:hypothetical protein